MPSATNTSSIDEWVLQNKKDLLENIKKINDLCFNPNAEITQETIDKIKKSIHRDTKFIVAKRYIDVDVFPYNDAYTDSRECAIENSKKKYTGGGFGKGFEIYNYSLNEGTCFISNNQLFKDMILDHNLLESGYKKQVYFDTVCIPSSAATLCFRKKFNNEYYKTDREVSLEEYIKAKIENEIRLAKHVKINSRFAGNIDSKIEMMNLKFEKVNNLEYFKNKEISKKQTNYGRKVSEEQTGDHKRKVSGTGIDSLINNAAQRTKNNSGNGNYHVTKEKYFNER